MNAAAEIILLPFLFLALGWGAYGILKLNSNRHFLSKQAFSLLSLLGFVFNMLGSVGCLKSLFHF